MSRKATLAAMMMLTSGSVPHSPAFRSMRPVRRESGGTISAACPRCKAEPQEWCDSRTLGRHLFHKARVDAHAAAIREALTKEVNDE